MLYSKFIYEGFLEHAISHSRALRRLYVHCAAFWRELISKQRNRFMLSRREKYRRLNQRRLYRVLHRRTILRERKKQRALKLDRVLRHAPLGIHPKSSKAVPTLTCPPRLNLSADYATTIEFLVRVREVATTYSGRFFVDLRPLSQISTAAALMLVAEFDRWRELTPQQRLTAVDPEDWHPKTRKRLADMGFFEMLAAPYSIDDSDVETTESFLQFRSGRGSEGHRARELRKEIETFGPRLKDSNTLYDGLVEAMTNVRQHAYQEGDRIPRWWMSASVNLDTERLVVTFVDHGLGIPRTLPRCDFWEEVRGWLAAAGASITRRPINDDSLLVRAAMSVERTRTDEEHRGHGLKRDIQGYIESHDGYGRLRIISGYGQYIYEKHPGGDPTIEVASMPLPIRGTFIEWTIQDYSKDDHNANN